MFDNNLLLNRIVEDLLCAGILLGLCVLIVAVPSRSNRPTSPSTLPAATEPSVTQNENVAPDSFTAPMLPSYLRAQ